VEVRESGKEVEAQDRQPHPTADAGDQASGIWLERNARDDLQYCSDLLEELLEKLRRMESDYLEGAEGPPSDPVVEIHTKERDLDVAK
jgi:hypothetical protein